MKMRRFLKCASVCAFASFLVACGNSSSSDKVEIEFFSQKPEMQATLQEIIDDFEKENPDIEVKFSNVPDAGTVLKTRMAMMKHQMLSISILKMQISKSMQQMAVSLKSVMMQVSAT